MANQSHRNQSSSNYYQYPPQQPQQQHQQQAQAYPWASPAFAFSTAHWFSAGQPQQAQPYPYISPLPASFGFGSYGQQLPSYPAFTAPTSASPHDNPYGPFAQSAYAQPPRQQHQQQPRRSPAKAAPSPAPPRPAPQPVPKPVEPKQPDHVKVTVDFATYLQNQGVDAEQARLLSAAETFDPSVLLSSSQAATSPIAAFSPVCPADPIPPVEDLESQRQLESLVAKHKMVDFSDFDVGCYQLTLFTVC